MAKPLLTHIILSCLIMVSAAKLFGQDITGDFSVCKGATEIYNISAGSAASSPWIVSPANAGTIISNGPNSVTIEWTTTAGNYKLQYSGGSINLEYPIVVEKTLSLACNKEITVSLDSDCDMEITADLVLEDMNYDDSSFEVILTDAETKIALDNNHIQGKHIGKHIEVMVVQKCTQNNCWGKIIAEDKNIPQMKPKNYVLNCHDDYRPHMMKGYPMEGHMETIDDYTYRVSGHNYCEDMTMSYRDSISHNECEDGFGIIMYRNWTLHITEQRKAHARDTIKIKKADIHRMTFPSDMKEHHALDCEHAGKESGYPVLENGHPHPDYTGYPKGPKCGNIEVKYEDLKFDGCGSASFKLKRTWQIFDWCSGDFVEHNQYIHVFDHTPPVCRPPAPFEAAARGRDCYASFIVPPPEVDDCSNYKIRVGYKMKSKDSSPYLDYHTEGVSEKDAEGWYRISGIEMPKDSMWIIYNVEDDCGNHAQTYCTIKVKDKEAPIAVCDDHTTIGLGEHGVAWADYRAFDDGSWDNCEIDSFLLRKIVGHYSCDSTTNWSERVKFCCNEIGETVKVEMKIKDSYGNVNTCWTDVTIQDNEPPKVYCPADTIVPCDLDVIVDFSPFGEAYYADFCGYTESDSISYLLNECGSGSILRTFSATDDWGNTGSCVQTIKVGAVKAFGSEKGHISWPKNTVLLECFDYDLSPENLDSAYAYPVFKSFPCSQPRASYEDTKFYHESDSVCVKVLREWTVIDWCQFDPTTSFNGSFTHTQIIKINDPTPPVITIGCEDFTAENAVNVTDCQFMVPEIRAEAVESSCPTKDLNWIYTIDLHSDGSIDDTGKAAVISEMTFETGIHTIHWTVKDKCGNESTCSQLVTIIDNTPPQAICINQLSIVINQDSKDVRIWASDFNLKTEDNCSLTDSLLISFSEDELKTSMTFTCADVDDSGTSEIGVSIYFFDDFGNKDHCQSTLILQSNAVDCDEASSSSLIEGTIRTNNGEPVKAVETIIQSMQTNQVKRIVSNGDGQFEFSQLNMFDDYELKFAKSDEQLKGVSTADLVGIQQHIIGARPLTEAWQIIAADANQSSTVSASDIILLRRLLIGLSDAWPNKKAWAFIDGDYSFSDQSNPFPFVEEVMVNNLSLTEMNKSISAIKLGDVNNSYTSDIKTSESRSSQTAKMIVEQVDEKVNFYIWDEQNIVGLQAALKISQNSIFRITSDHLEFGTDYNIISDGNSQWMLISYIRDIKSLQKNDTPLFVMHDIESKESVTFDQSYLTSELYRDNGSDLDIQYLELIEKVTRDEFEVFQNQPNPFNHSTVIPIYVPVADQFLLNIYNVAGELIAEEKKSFSTGHHNWSIDAQSLQKDGIYYYTISNDEHLYSRKMIMIR